LIWPDVQNIIAIVGAVIVAATIALVQTDIKKVLLGLTDNFDVLALGLGAYE
jgi:NADH:ubiquinone oxidoreductase subunit 5 (subunit L)/multisubunit Na+/H+ antiporter MnhA subunit